MEANTMNHVQTAHKTPNLGPECLQYRLPKYLNRREDDTTKVVTGRLRVNTLSLTSYLFSING